MNKPKAALMKTTFKAIDSRARVGRHRFTLKAFQKFALRRHYKRFGKLAVLLRLKD